MPAPFHPPGLSSLADVDVARVEYDEECVVIDGIVSPQGQGAFVRDGFHVHMFTLAAWKQVEGPVVDRNLLVLRPVPPEYNWRNDFPSFSPQRMRVLLSQERDRGIFDGSFPSPPPDAELLAITERLQKPVVIRTKLFGELTLDRTINWFEGEAEWSGRVVQVHFPTEEERLPDDVLRTGEALWSDQSGWEKRIEACAVKHLLDVKNENWLDEGESELTAQQFLALMTLTTISISANGRFEFWYDDGDLFWGHSIVVEGTVQEGPTDAGIHG